MIKLEGLTKRQRKIADALWGAQGFDEVNSIIEKYGQEAIVLRDLILLACIDEDAEELVVYSDAIEAIDRIKGKA